MELLKLIAELSVAWSAQGAIRNESVAADRKAIQSLQLRRHSGLPPRRASTAGTRALGRAEGVCNAGI